MSTQPSDDPIDLSQVISGMANDLENKKKKLKLLEQALEARRHRRHKKEQQKKWTIGGFSVLGTLGLGAIGLKFNFWGKRNSAFEAPSSEPQTYIKAAALEKIKGAINWRKNNVGPVQITEGVPLGKLQEYQALGGIRAISSGTAEGVTISQNTLNELKNLAKAAGIANPEKQNEMIAQYIRGYDQYMANHTDPTSEIKTKALAASLGEVQKYIENNTGPMSWLRDARNTVVATLTNTAERVVGSIPINSSVAAEVPPAVVSSAPNPIQSFLSHTQEAMSSAMHQVGDAAQHVSHAVGQVVKSEPVQAALHNSATYTAVSLAVTAASVRFQAVREARQAEDGPKLNFVANARGLAQDFFTRDVGGPNAYRAQLDKAQTKVALGRAALAAICPPVAIAATAMGVTAFGAGIVHHVTRDRENLAGVARASKYLAEMKYVNQATNGMARGFTAAKTFATKAASSPLVTQAMEVTQTTMQTATNVVQSTRDRVAAFFTQRQTAAAL